MSTGVKEFSESNVVINPENVHFWLMDGYKYTFLRMVGKCQQWKCISKSCSANFMYLDGRIVPGVKVHSHSPMNKVGKQLTTDGVSYHATQQSSPVFTGNEFSPRIQPFKGSARKTSEHPLQRDRNRRGNPVQPSAAKSKGQPSWRDQNVPATPDRGSKLLKLANGAPGMVLVSEPVGNSSASANTSNSMSPCTLPTPALEVGSQSMSLEQPLSHPHILELVGDPPNSYNVPIVVDFADDPPTCTPQQLNPSVIGSPLKPQKVSVLHPTTSSAQPYTPQPSTSRASGLPQIHLPKPTKVAQKKTTPGPRVVPQLAATSGSSQTILSQAAISYKHYEEAVTHMDNDQFGCAVSVLLDGLSENEAEDVRYEIATLLYGALLDHNRKKAK